jgi:hypothetical protein
MKLKLFLFIAVLFISMNSMATPKDSAYTYRFSVENHFGHTYLNFQLDSSWYFEKEEYQNKRFVYNKFQNPTLKEELNIIQLSADFSFADIGKSKIPSKILALNFKQVAEQYKSADYEQKMGYVQLDIPHKKAVLNLKRLGIAKGFLLVYELHDRSTWMMWYPSLTEAKKDLLKMREDNAERIIYQNIIPTRKHTPPTGEKEDDESFVDTEFPGGYDKLSLFINKMIEFPESFMEFSFGQKDGKYKERVIMCCVIHSDGSIDDFFIENMDEIDCPSIVNATIKLYRAMPNWNPAIRDRKPCATYLRLPIRYETF